MTTRIVPSEPTEEMVERAKYAFCISAEADPTGKYQGKKHLRAAIKAALDASPTDARDAVLEEVAKFVDEFGWQLPMYNSQHLNDISDDTACAVQEQIAVAIRALKGTHT